MSSIYITTLANLTVEGSQNPEVCLAGCNGACVTAIASQRLRHGELTYDSKGFASSSRALYGSACTAVSCRRAEEATGMQKL